MSKKRKLIKLSSLFVGMAVVASLSFTIGLTHSKKVIHVASDTTSSDKSQIAEQPLQSLSSSGIDIYDLWNRTNQARATAGLSALKLNPLLDNSATAKCTDMVVKNYWAHNDPSGVEPWHFIKEAGVPYTTAGENLAYGFNTTQDVFSGWMNSEEHKDNILNASYTDVGFAVCVTSSGFSGTIGPSLLVVQHFTG